MAGEESYIHPIIQGFLAGATQAKEAGQYQTSLKQRQQEHQDEIKHQQEQLKQAQQRIDQEHDLNAKKFDLDTQQFKLQQEHYKNEFTKAVAEHIRGGGNASAYQNPGIDIPIPGVGVQKLFKTPEDQVTIMGRNVPISSFQTADQAISQAARAKGAMVTAEKTAEKPFEVEAAELKLTNLKKFTEFENTFKEKAAKSKQDFDANEGKLDRVSREKMNAATNWTHLKTAASSQITPEQVKAVMYSAATGGMKLDASNPIERQAMAGMQQVGLKTVDPKMAEGLKNSQIISQEFLKKIEDFANKLPSEKSTLGSVQAAVQGGLNKISPIPTDLMTEVNQINANALNLGKMLEGQSGRPTNLQLDLDLKSLVNPSLTKEKQLSNLNNIKQMLKTKINDVFLGGLDESQKKMIFERHGIAGETLQEHNGKKYPVRYNPKTHDYDVIGPPVQ